jgi:hypothetical protein
VDDNDTVLDAEELIRGELERIRNRLNITEFAPLKVSKMDAMRAVLADSNSLVTSRRIAREYIRQHRKKNTAKGNKHYMRKRKSLRKRVFKFYWGNVWKRRLHTFKHDKKPDVVLFTELEYEFIRTQFPKQYLQRIDKTLPWSWENTVMEPSRTTLEAFERPTP